MSENNSSPSWLDLAKGLAEAAGDLAESARIAGAPVADQLRTEVLRQVATATSSTTTSTTTGEPQATALDRVEVRATGRRVTIIGDATVANLRVEGPHSASREARVVEVVGDGDLAPGKDALGLLAPALGLRQLDALDSLKKIGVGRELVVRVNPGIELDVEVTGGSLVVSGMPRLGRVRVTGGTATIRDVETLARGLFQAGQTTLSGTFAHGASRLRGESGQLTLVLDEQADVQVTGRSQLSRITWPDGIAVDSYRVGEGTGRVELDLVMGQATVRHEPPA